MNMLWEMLQDGLGGGAVMYSCPRCGKRNIILPTDDGHECLCGEFGIHFGEAFEQFHRRSMHSVAAHEEGVAA